MSVLAAVLLLALTRAEIVERFHAAPVSMVDGFVQVSADCPRDIRREYQKPVASFSADICRSLYGARMEKPRHFDHPAILIHLGDVTNRVTNVVTRLSRHADGSRFVRVYLPAPGSSDRLALALATARAFSLAIDGREIGDAEALGLLRNADPDFRLEEACRRLADWRDRGIYAPGMTDEDYLKLLRKVQRVGTLTLEEARTFASRLVLLPLLNDAPFCGKYRELSFADAIAAAREDVTVRLAAAIKARQIVIFGAGRGEGLQNAADAYSKFLEHLSLGETSEADLRAELAKADAAFYRACGIQ